MAENLKAIAKRLADSKAKNVIARPSPAQLPLWGERFRGLPNSIARSALFTCANRRAPRSAFKNSPIATIAGLQIFYTGEELRQDDEDVFLQIVHLARNEQLGEKVKIRGNQLLRILGWNNSSRDYDRLRDCIERLKTGSVKIVTEDRSKGYMGSLIRKFTWEDSESAERGARPFWQIFLEPEMVKLFGDDNYSLIEWQARKALGPMAKWQLSFYITHKNPLPYKTATFLTLCGAKTTDLRGFRRTYKSGLDELVAINFLSDWKHIPESDTFHVTRADGPLLIPG